MTVHLMGVDLGVERRLPACPTCGGRVYEGDRAETPPFYCDYCGVGWNTFHQLMNDVQKSMYGEDNNERKK